MSKKSAKKDRRLLLRWLMALAVGLGLMAALAVTLRHCSPEPPEPTAPTLAPNPYGPTDFSREGDYLTCLSGESLPGIDVSYYQGTIDWPAVKASGIEFAMIRVGYRGFEDGTLHEDENVRQNLAGAKAAGLRVGAYFFSQALTVEEAREEAQFALHILKNYRLDMPVVFDWEYVAEDSRTGAMEPDTLAACARAFCEEIKAAGYEPMVYFNQELAKTLLDLTQVADYPFWLAMYNDQMTWPHKITMWQYTDQGTVPGIEGNVDLNLWLPQ